MPKIHIKAIEAFRVDLRTRMPFRYGIATMTELPHVFIRLTAEIGQHTSTGLAADHLPPRWFKKDPDQHPLDEIEEMLQVIEHAVTQAEGSSWASPFDWWLAAYEEQMAWARENKIPPLLAHFGVSLVERALLDASIQAGPSPNFYTALCSGELGFSLDAFPEFPSGWSWQSFFRESPPLETVAIRHTVGLSDPVFASELSSGSRPDDPLPASLEEVIRHYGIHHFKIKVAAQLDADIERLNAISRCFHQLGLTSPSFSLDGNELYSNFDEFHQHWETLQSHCPLLKEGTLLWIEQPVSRNSALDPQSVQFATMQTLPPVIIDESDADMESLPQAMELGYAGVSHKNCKGIFKSLVNRCRLNLKQTSRTGSPLVMSGEDLSTIGPISTLQDLTIQAVLGNRSVERNGHHFFCGLSAFPPSINRLLVEQHPDLYTMSSTSPAFATLNIRNGNLDLNSLLIAGLGPNFSLDLSFAQRFR